MQRGRRRVSSVGRLITGAFVSALAHPDFLAEMEAIAIVPE